MITDKEGVIQVKDPQVFAIIYNRFYTSVFLLANKYMKDQQDAQDIRANAFIKLWELREELKFKNWASLYSWIRTTVVNSCIDNKRHKLTRELKRPTIELLIYTQEPREVFEATDKEAVILERLIKQIERLPEKFKIVFKMRTFNELKFREIAEILNTDVSTTKKRYSRAVYLLKIS